MIGKLELKNLMDRVIIIKVKKGLICSFFLKF